MRYVPYIALIIVVGMDLALMIYEVARDQARKECQYVIVEVVHSIFDDYSCSQWIRIEQNKKNRTWTVIHKGVPMVFHSPGDIISNGCDLIIRNMLHDFLSFFDGNLFSDMDYLSINVHSGKERLSILHNYFTTELFIDAIGDIGSKEDKQMDTIISNFKRQVMFACRAVS
jgi:hypothetical protein